MPPTPHMVFHEIPHSLSRWAVADTPDSFTVCPGLNHNPRDYAFRSITVDIKRIATKDAGVVAGCGVRVEKDVTVYNKGLCAEISIVHVYWWGDIGAAAYEAARMSYP